MTFIRSRTAQALLGPLAAVAVIAVTNSGAIPPFQTYSIALAAVYTIVVLSVGLLAGWSGVWSVGHPAFFALGAYFAAYGSGHGWSLETIVIGTVANLRATKGYPDLLAAARTVVDRVPTARFRRWTVIHPRGRQWQYRPQSERGCRSALWRNIAIAPTMRISECKTVRAPLRC